MAGLINVHGARLLVPAEWEDVSIYRFLPPVGADDGGILMAKKPRRAQPNVVVTRHSRIDGDRPEKFLEVMNAKSTLENKTYRVLGSGVADYLGQQAVWQDSRQSALEEELEVQQRHILVPGWEAELVLITLTGDKDQIESMSKVMGFFTSRGQTG